MIGGPVFLHELAASARLPRTYLLRAAYVGALFGLAAAAWLILFGGQPVRSFSDMARFGSAAWTLIAPVQLAVSTAFAALLAAASVAQEKDRRTFDLLLMTRLTDLQLATGRLLASLVEVLSLIVAAFPLGVLLSLLGGVSLGQLGRCLAVTIAAGVAAGSLGSMIGLWREKSFQSLALTALALVGWLLVGEFVAAGAGGAVDLAAAGPLAAATTPLRALLVAMEPRAEPPGAASANLAADPAMQFVALAAFAAALLTTWATIRLRAWNPPRELRVSDQPEEPPAVAGPAEAIRRHAAPGAAQEVWDNPVLWREMCTWAYGRKVILIRVVYVALAVACGVAMIRLSGDEGGSEQVGAAGPAARVFVPVVAVGLLLVNALAVTSLTNERDGRALDLLLVTDLTPREIIYGKLGGVLYNAKEMVLAPIVLAGAAWLTGIANGEQAALLVATLAIADGFVAMLGLHAGMTYANSRTAVLASLGTLLFLMLGIAVCMRMMIAFQTSFQYQLQVFAAFMLGGGVGLYWVLGSRNPSPAIFWASIVAPFATFYAITAYLRGSYGAASLVAAATYGFATAAMLVPAIAEFDVATGRTSARDV